MDALDLYEQKHHPDETMAHKDCLKVAGMGSTASLHEPVALERLAYAILHCSAFELGKDCCKLGSLSAGQVDRRAGRSFAEVAEVAEAAEVGADTVAAGKDRSVVEDGADTTGGQPAAGRAAAGRAAAERAAEGYCRHYRNQY